MLVVISHKYEEVVDRLAAADLGSSRSLEPDASPCRRRCVERTYQYMRVHTLQARMCEQCQVVLSGCTSCCPARLLWWVVG
jgi:hypothetical protein